MHPQSRKEKSKNTRYTDNSQTQRSLSEKKHD